MVLVVSTAACWESQALVGVSHYSTSTLPVDLLKLAIDDGHGPMPLPKSYVGIPPTLAHEVGTRKNGTLRVIVHFEDSRGVVSEGTVAVPLHSDWRYGFQIFVDSIDPKRGCFGCIGSQAFPLAAAYRRTSGDSMWIVWGGNSIRHPAIY